jgi:hypothetical protein
MDQTPNDDVKLRFVDPENRTEIDRFERLDDAELACGLLRPVLRVNRVRRRFPSFRRTSFSG